MENGKRKKAKSLVLFQKFCFSGHMFIFPVFIDVHVWSERPSFVTLHLKAPIFSILKIMYYFIINHYRFFVYYYLICMTDKV